MKKITLLFYVVISTATAMAQDINIPDANFLAKLIELGVDTSGDNIIQQSEALVPTQLYLGYSDIVNTTGIGYFTNVTFIDLNFNHVTAIDISALQQMTSIQLNSNELSDMDFSQNPNLTVIDIAGNDFTEVDLRSQPNLSFVLFENCTQLNSVYVKNNSNEWMLTFFNCPSLSYICADEADVSTLQTQMTTLGYTNVTVDSNCALDIKDQNIPEIMLFPNPVSDLLTVSSSALIGKITLYNMSGQKLGSSDANHSEAKINMSEYPGGIYIAQIESSGNIRRFKVLKN